ncbi:MAG: TIGR00159 family protein [Armatimonadetes bacterium]|nr:TIGR00159 family protein [Armatimonadota bacterium]
MELLRRLLQRAFTPEGALDILLVWFLVYELLLLLKGSHASRLRGLGLGLGVLAALWLLTRPDRGLLKLETFNWLVSQIAPFGLYALVVVFQPEIRESFGQLGQVSLFGRPVAAPSRSVVVHLVNEIVEACEELSVRRIGALIAIERRDDLGAVVETGRELGGTVSAELLATIFFPNTPLHDGAVVARRDQLLAAGCLLPLSERRDLARTLGTRHRAALGLTERSDAVVVVVSEETGLVSLAYGGELYRGIKEEDLKGRLLELLQPAGTSLLSGAAPGGRR